MAQIPYVRVRIDCLHCPRRREYYSLARLAERYGVEADLSAVLAYLTRSSQWQVQLGTRRRKYVPYCGAYYRYLKHRDAARRPVRGAPAKHRHVITLPPDLWTLIQEQ